MAPLLPRFLPGSTQGRHLSTHAEHPQIRHETAPRHKCATVWLLPPSMGYRPKHGRKRPLKGCQGGIFLRAIVKET